MSLGLGRRCSCQPCDGCSRSACVSLDRGRLARHCLIGRGHGLPFRFVSGLADRELPTDRLLGDCVPRIPLLNGVRCFVRDQFLSVGRIRLILPRSEEDVLTGRERMSLHRPRGDIGGGIRMDANPGEVRSKGSF